MPSPSKKIRCKYAVDYIRQLKEQGIVFPQHVMKDICDTYIKNGENLYVDTGYAHKKSGRMIIIAFD